MFPVSGVVPSKLMITSNCLVCKSLGERSYNGDLWSILWATTSGQNNCRSSFSPLRLAPKWRLSR